MLSSGAYLCLVLERYCCLVGRWERLAVCFNAFLALAMIYIWIQRLTVG